MLSLPAAWRWLAWNSWSMSSTSASRGRIRSSSCVPSAVRRTWRVVRCSSRAPTWPSSCWTAADTEARGSSSVWAALMKLPISATWAKTRYWSNLSMRLAFGMRQAQPKA
ncbi:Uncharacterised protein [Bordetella pertussis]|nr:Uncharacterised protein [Bordetella pertussis]